MRTELKKNFTWGFILSEQELRRISQSCNEHADKTGSAVRRSVAAKLRDGALIESHQLEDILSLENGGTRAVERVSIKLEEDTDEPAWSILVQFEDGVRNPKSWTSAMFEVVGDSRDWVFVTSADLEERIKNTRTLSWPRIVTHQWFLIIPMVIAMAAFIFSTELLSPRMEPVLELERQYIAGEISDPIQAMITLDKLKNELGIGPLLWPIFISFSIPILIFLVGIPILPRIFPSYNFYWGDYAVFFDRRRALGRIIWGVLGLGVIASLIAGIALRYI